MPLRDELLNPIPGANPAGADLRYDPLYEKVKEARREDEDIPQGGWQHARKLADWPAVVRLTSEALTAKSKDLQLAAWLTEAMLRREGVAGLKGGLDLLRGLLAQFWDTLYPELEDGDAELRAAPLEWVGLRLELPLRQVPINAKGHDLVRYKESRTVPSESDAGADPAKAEARQQAIQDGKLTPEEFAQAVDATPKAWYKALVADLDAALASLQALDATGRERFGDAAPSYLRLREALEEVRRVAQQFLIKKLELDPDPVEAQEPAPAADAAAGAFASDAAQPAGSGRLLSAEPTSIEDAAARVAGAARFLRRTDPRNPAPYLLLRGFRWGELRACGRVPNPRLLEAPPIALRTQLKGFLIDAAWPQLLETAEAVMATPHGRGWLDLQRYALRACEGLGADYDNVAAAIRGELRSLLVEMPQLPDMTLMDDTPTANRETQAWLRDVILAGGDAAPTEPGSAGAAAAGTWRENGRIRTAGDAYERAMAEVRAGRSGKAIEILTRELEREQSRRGRFLRKAQLAHVMVDTGLEAVARPILEELLAQVEEHKLENWEAGDVVAEPLALLYRCLAKLDGESELKMSLYLRVCRLDPVQAVSFAQA